jgi:RNA polymerase primary sigma factor
MKPLVITQTITRRESRSVEQYLQEISRYDQITPEEEAELSRKIRMGDDSALDKLVRSNLRFVVSVAKQYQHTGIGLNDLINEGNVGLIKAAKRFDETRGFKFISYAVWWIRQSIIQSILEKSRKIRLPANQLNTSMKISRASSRLEQNYGREPTPEEIEAETGIREEEVRKNQSRSRRCLSIDAPVPNSEDMSLNQVISDDKVPSPDQSLDKEESMKIEISQLMAVLSAREAEVLEGYFGLNGRAPMTLEDLGRNLELTRERIRQIKNKALKKLKIRASHSGLFPNFN